MAIIGPGRLPGIYMPDAAQPAQTKTTNAGGPRQDFASVFEQALKTQDVTFSKHAAQRLETRSITLGGEELAKLSQAVDKASQKGVRDSLVVMDSLAFIVNVPQRTVITAMPLGEAQGNVFTNLDGAVIV